MNLFTKEYFFSFQGRLNRQPFWMFVLVYMGVMVVASLLDAILGIGLFSVVAALALFYSSICIGIKRWHDRDKSGWWMLIGLVPVIGFIWYLVECGFLQGTPGPNRFGPDPLGGAGPAPAA